jgi:hypothetical protein
MNVALDRSTRLDEPPSRMDRDPNRPRFTRTQREPRGLAPPRPAGAPAPWRSVVEWLRGDREHIDQQGLLVGRNLRAATRRTRRESESAGRPAPPDETA